MKDKKRRAKLEEIVRYHSEALRLAGGMSANQRRFIEVAARYGKELEPDGWLAGGGSQVRNPEEEN
ncbi:hypothetical protein ABIA54_002488 [Pseudomonas sp. EB276 TE3739]|uniref:hypothetical protein n=1 Tax=Pseudomonas TaxID=286 RepID=UPI0020A0EFD1|nr:hypothetical protein [Pseudomonas koreensis]MCP1473427.1 hypothetical protein [Pseudomonas koreensis]